MTADEVSRSESISRALAAAYRALSDDELSKLTADQSERRECVQRLLNYESIVLNLLNMERYDRDCAADRAKQSKARNPAPAAAGHETPSEAADGI